MTVDKIRVRYYYDNTGHWHRRFLMGHYGMEMSPVLVGACGLLLAPSPPGGRDEPWPQYYWRLLDGRVQRAAGRQGI
jgi:hypothetical protein